MNLIKKIKSFVFLSLEGLFFLIIFSNIWVFAVTNGKTFTKISKISPREVALVLGTSPKMMSGVANPYFTRRMEAAAMLYHHGKIRKIIVSGEKSKGYDEPAAMKKYLIYQVGVPENVIIEDPKGFNTYKSITRCKEVYKKNNIIIVSQGYHNLRALFVARNKNMNALGYDARDVSQPKSFFRNQFREILARLQTVLYYVFGVSPD